MNTWKLSTLILGFLVVILFIYDGSEEVTTSDSQTVAQNAVDFINKNLLQGQTAILKSVEVDKGLYKLNISIDGVDYNSYVTKDGKFLFPTPPIELIEISETQQPTQDIPTSDKPNVKFFVMSFCPYGQQAETGLKPVFELLGNKIEMEPHYVIYSNYAGGGPSYCLDDESNYCSMHGINELMENVRQLCINKYYDAGIWWDYVSTINNECSLQNIDTCWEEKATALSIDVDKIKDCENNEALDLVTAEKALNDDYGIGGSPTIFINEELYSGGRSPEAYKTAICSGFTTPPTECSEELSSPSVQQTAPTQGCG